MLLDFNQIYKKYNLNISGVISIGAYMGDEYNLYKHLNIPHIMWIEAQEQLCKMISHRCPSDIVINAVVAAKDGEKRKFNITNNYSSSSLLELKEHITLHPEVFLSEQIDCETQTLDSILQKMSPEITNKFNMLNIDTQGAELEVLTGAKNTLNQIDYIYTEVNVSEVYKGCPSIWEIDRYLEPFGFRRVETGIFANAWGDAFYIKEIK